MNGKQYISGTKSGLKKFAEANNQYNNTITALHGTKEPDEWYLNYNNDLYIIEKKFQQDSGSVCEKLQTAYVKKEHYKIKYPNYNINYIYCLSNWFKDNCKGELILLKYWGIPVYWGEKDNYIEQIINDMK